MFSVLRMALAPTRKVIVKCHSRWSSWSSVWTCRGLGEAAVGLSLVFFSSEPPELRHLGGGVLKTMCCRRPMPHPHPTPCFSESGTLLGSSVDSFRLCLPSPITYPWLAFSCVFPAHAIEPCGGPGTGLQHMLCGLWGGGKGVEWVRGPVSGLLRGVTPRGTGTIGGC